MGQAPSFGAPDASIFNTAAPGMAGPGPAGPGMGFGGMAPPPPPPKKEVPEDTTFKGMFDLGRKKLQDKQ